MSEGYRNATADAGGALITYIGLVDASGTELSGGSPAYARKAVSWLSASSGTVRPDANLTFDIPASGVVAGWRGFSASSGGTNYGGEDFAEEDRETFANQGQFTLLAASTGILHAAA